MDKIQTLYGYLSRYKYLIITVVGTIVVGFVGENSIYHSIVMEYEIMDLKSDIEYYTTAYESDKRNLHELERDQRNIERVARERYYMKADDEDIFVLSTDNKTKAESEEDER